jgi:pimeloyl-ACP methyl ester carboxylesterase
MGLKFNCSNPECRQRIEVEDVLAGQTMLCPKCATELHVPVSHDLKFTCTNSDCRQHVVVDVAEAGRFVKCPSCGKALRVPGDPPKPLVTPPTKPAQAAESVVVSGYQEPWSEALKRWTCGWGIGAVLLGVIWLGLRWGEAAVGPPNLTALAEEIHYRFYPDPNRPPAQVPLSQELPVVEKSLTNASGRVVNYFYLAPPVLSPGRKYPVVVDQSSSIRNRRMRDMQFLAHAGIYYLSPNSYGITNWRVARNLEDVLPVLAEFGKLPSVDTNRFYVMGQSATTGAAVQLVNFHPELWRGLLLMEPGGGFPRLPEPGRKFPSIFITLGDNDRYNMGPLGTPGRAEKFLLEASAKKIPVRIDYQYGDHGYPPEQLKRAYIAAVKFIYADY